MIVLGADTHKRSHTIAAVVCGDGRGARREDGRGRRARVRGAAGLGARARRASGSGRLRTAGTSPGPLERFLIGRGERVVRVATKLMADARRGAPDARASPTASTRSRSPGPRCAKDSTRCRPRTLDGPELDLRLLVDHRERLVRAPRRAQQHAAMAPARPLARARASGRRAVLGKWSTRIGRRLARAEQTDARPDRPRRAAATARADPGSIKALEPEIAELVAAVAPQLLCRARLRTADRGQARRRDRRRRPLRDRRQARPRRRPGADPGQLGQDQPPPPRPRRQPPDSTPPSTASRSPAPAATPKPATTSTANAPKARPPAKPSAASNATSPAASGTSSNRPHPDSGHAITHQLLDIGAAQAGAAETVPR